LTNFHYGLSLSKTWSGEQDVDRSIRFANRLPPRVAQSRLQRRLAGFSPQ
jgi:hypothetical protein